MIKDKYLNIDLYRLIASFLVVAIHTYPLDFISPNLDYFFTRILFRIAVPLFVMITGYYIIPRALKDKNELKKYTLKIIKIYLISIIIYLPLNIYNGYFNNFNIFTFIKDIFLNGIFYHLWYFPALILGLWLTYFIIKKFKFKVIITLISLLYIIGLFGDSYYYLISDNLILRNIYDFIFIFFDYTRNGLFYIPIFLYMGYYFNNKKFNKLNIYLIISLILMMIEGIILYIFKIPKHNSMYLFLIPTMFLIFNFIINKNLKTDKKIRNCATYLYIMHPLFIVIIRLLSKILKFKTLNNSFINYILVILSTILFISLINKLKKYKKG